MLQLPFLTHTCQNLSFPFLPFHFFFLLPPLSSFTDLLETSISKNAAPQYNLSIQKIILAADYKSHQTSHCHVKAHTNKTGEVSTDFALLPGFDVLVGPLVAEVEAAQQACMTGW